VNRTSPTAAGQRSLVALTKGVLCAIVIGFLYFGKPILLPLALAIFLVLILTPMVTGLTRRHVPRTVSVLAVVLVVGVVLAGVVTLVSLELTSLIEKLPTHTENIKSKVRSVRGLGEGAFVASLDRMWTEVRGEWQFSPATLELKQVPVPSSPAAGAESPVSPASSSDAPWAKPLPNLLRQAVNGAVTLGLALVLAFFILLRREALRNRVIRLVGGSLIVTTKAVDDAGERISRYLRMQLIINSTYGAIWGLGLYFIGLEYAALWGFLAALLRFVPYIGPWIGGVLPLTLALAQFSGWSELATILGLLLVLELLSNNVMEPMLYGNSTGVSAVALLVSAVFWTTLWGPVGLVLSGPITVCLAVTGKYFPQVAFLDLLLGDEPVLEPHVGYYQRLIARDQDEATQLVLAQTKTKPLDQVFDEMLISALNLIKQDRVRTDVTEADEQYVVATTREIVEDLAVDDPVDEATHAGHDEKNAIPEHAPPGYGPRIRLMGFPARDAEDQLALEMLKSLMNEKEWDFEIEPAGGASTGEWVERVAERDPAIVCVASLPPGGLAHTRYVCKKLRSRFPGIRIAVGRWGLQVGNESDQENIEAVGADHIATTLRETRDQLNSWLPVFTQKDAKKVTDESAPDTFPDGRPSPILISSAG